MPGTTSRTDLLIRVACLLVLGLAAGGGLLDAQEAGAAAGGEFPLWTALRRELAAGGPFALLLGFAAMMIVAILPIPAEVPAALNGMFLGPWVGSAVTWAGAVTGALISFEVARRLGRPLMGRLAAPRVVQALDRTAETIGARGLFVVRLIPLIAFTAINYAAGLSAVPRWTFVWTTALGILPGTLLMTSSGSGLAALYRANQALAVALTVGLVVVLVVWRLQRPAGPDAG